MVKSGKFHTSDIEEFISENFDVSFSFEKDTCYYKVDNIKEFVKDSNKWNDNTLFNCVKIGKGYYDLFITEANFELFPLNVVDIKELEGENYKQPLIIAHEEIAGNNQTIDLTNEWIYFRKEKISQNNIEL